jgi:hypothetical protein
VALAETTCSQFSTQSREIVEVSPSEPQLVPNSGSPAALAAAWMLMLGVSVGAVAVLVCSFVAVAVAGWIGAGVAAIVGSVIAVAGACAGSAVAGAG